MKFLLTNDDGIDAPGIKALANAVRDAKIIVAPKFQMSECGHRFTVRSPISVDKKTDSAYAVDGTPADCTRLGLAELATDIDWVLSGVNAGGNLGVDIYTSGTVAAVREATILGKPAIAFSHFVKRPLEIDWDLVTRWTEIVLTKLLATELKDQHFWNVNFPHLVEGMKPKMIFCERSLDPMQVVYTQIEDQYQYSGSYHDRARTANSDVDICFSGNIAISQIAL
ncbi:MAG: 5'/3'-nucleotidase SurE [Limnothrix sp.]